MALRTRAPWYAADVCAIVRAANIELDATDPIVRHLNWALAYADKIDPLRAVEREIESRRVPP